MPTPSRHDPTAGIAGNEGGNVLDSGQREVWSGSKGRMAGPSPSPAKARQAQRRYRSLFHQAAKEYQAWCEGEDDTQRALGSVFHLLDRLRILEPDQPTEIGEHLGGLKHLPEFQTLLIRKHTLELERVMRLWRALVQQMRGQVTRVEESLAEAWQLHRSEAQARPLPLPSRPLPGAAQHFLIHESATGITMTSSPAPLRSRAGQQQPLYLEKDKEFQAERVSPSDSPSPGPGMVSPREMNRGNVGARSGRAMSVTAATAGGNDAATLTPGLGRASSVVGPAEYLQWLEDMSNMLVHEQWRKEELLSCVDFGPELSSTRVRSHIQAKWSSRSSESYLNRALLEEAMNAAHVVFITKTR